MQVYEDGTRARIGDVVMGDGKPTRYIVVGFEEHSAIILPIGTVRTGDAALLGKTIFIQPALRRVVPLSGFTRLGYADITVVKDSIPSGAFDAE